MVGAVRVHRPVRTEALRHELRELHLPVRVQELLLLEAAAAESPYILPIPYAIEVLLLLGIVERANEHGLADARARQLDCVLVPLVELCDHAEVTQRRAVDDHVRTVSHLNSRVKFRVSIVSGKSPLTYLRQKLGVRTIGPFGAQQPFVEVVKAISHRQRWNEAVKASREVVGLGKERLVRVGQKSWKTSQ